MPLIRRAISSAPIDHECRQRQTRSCDRAAVARHGRNARPPCRWRAPSASTASAAIRSRDLEHLAFRDRRQPPGQRVRLLGLERALLQEDRGAGDRSEGQKPIGDDGENDMRVEPAGRHSAGDRPLGRFCHDSVAISPSSSSSGTSSGVSRQACRVTSAQAEEERHGHGDADPQGHGEAGPPRAAELVPPTHSARAERRPSSNDRIEQRRRAVVRAASARPPTGSSAASASEAEARSVIANSLIGPPRLGKRARHRFSLRR